MPERARPIFASELRQCLTWIADSAAARSNPAALIGGAGNNASRATVSAQGKVYAIGREKGALTAYPVRVKRPISQEELESRLVPRSNPTQALNSVRSRASGFTVAQSKFFVLASRSPAHTETVLAAMGERLDDYVGFLGRTFGLEPPKMYMTVYLFPDIQALRQWALTFHGLDASPATLGYALENDISVLAMVSSTTGIGTLLHEVFHIVVRGSYSSIPQWLDEGIASLYETSTAVPGYYFGEPNWRSPVFREFSHVLTQIRLADVITAPWFSDEQNVHAALGEREWSEGEQAYILAYARMFMLYLQEKGTLIEVFDAFRKRKPPAMYIPAKTQAIQLLETSMKMAVHAIEADFHKWAPTAFDPDRRFYAGRPIPKEFPQTEFPLSVTIQRELPALEEASMFGEPGTIERE
jgi:hypothetical protein